MIKFNLLDNHFFLSIFFLRFIIWDFGCKGLKLKIIIIIIKIISIIILRISMISIITLRLILRSELLVTIELLIIMFFYLIIDWLIWHIKIRWIWSISRIIIKCFLLLLRHLKIYLVLVIIINLLITFLHF